MVYFAEGRKAVVTTKWHLIEYIDGSVELYDRVNDPWALTNLALLNPITVRMLIAVEM